MEYTNILQPERKLTGRLIKDRLFRILFQGAMLFGIVMLGILLYRIIGDGIGEVNLSFLTQTLSTDAEKAGILGALLGTMWLMVVVAPTTLLIGTGTALYLELYAKKGKLKSFIQMNIANLAGVPSIVYGILGMTVFMRFLGMDNIVLTGGLTLSLLILPIMIVASQEAIRAVPSHLTEASYAMGATKWQTIYRVVLPVAIPSMLTGGILALSRAIGETAPLIVIGIPALLIPLPGGIWDKFTILPVQIYYWTLDSMMFHEYAGLAAATILILLVLMLLLNGTAIFIRYKFQKKNEEGAG